EFGGATQSIGIEVINRQPGVVLLDQYERWAADDSAIADAQALGDRSNQVCFAGAKRANESHHSARQKHAAQATPKTEGGVQVRDLELEVHGSTPAKCGWVAGAESAKPRRKRPNEWWLCQGFADSAPATP